MIERGLKHFRLRFGFEAPPSSGMREALQWLMLARLGLLYLTLSVIVLQQVLRREAFSGFQMSVAYALLATSFAFNFFHALFIEKLPMQWWVAGTHVLFDAMTTSCWILFSGGKESLFALVYLVQILAVSLILYQKGALLASVLSCVCFGLVSWIQPQPAAFLTWSIYSAIFVILGVVGGYLSEELVRTTESLNEKSKKIVRLTELHERILSNMPTGLLTVDREMRINFANPAAEGILGKVSAEMVGKTLSEVEGGLLPFFTQIETEEVKDDEEPSASGPTGVETGVSATGSEHHRSFFVNSKSDKGRARLQQRVEIGRGTQMRILRGDVAVLDAAAGLGKLLDEEASGGRVLLFQDVTKLLHLEEKLKQNEKLAAVGQLAAGIAHEIRNPLASMSASIEMLKGSLPPDSSQSENQKLMEIAIREIDRLNRLISEFLDFVKPEKFRFERVDLTALLGEVVLSVQRSKDRRFPTEIKEAYRPQTIALGNAEKLRQVVWNLLVNALQAMNKSGTINIGCGPVNDQRVMFWVEDQGQGMSEEVMTHLYEPFFTTKEKGTGLGLATAYKIIEAHHGEIRVTSTLNVGTRFEIQLQSA